MDSLPRSQKHNQVLDKRDDNSCQIAPAEAVVLAQGNRTDGSVQFKDSFVSLPDDMNVRRTVVIGVYDDPQVANPENGRHTPRAYHKTQAIRFNIVAPRA